MNLELYIARKVLNFKQSKDSISGPIAKIAVTGIALSIMVIICTVFIVTGFKKEVSNKLTGFGGHIQITKMTSNTSYELPPVTMEQDFYPGLNNRPGIKNIQVFALKTGIIKTDEVVQAVVFKGIGSDFDWGFFKENLVKGEIFEVNDSVKTNQVIISKSLSNILKLDTGQRFNIYFINEPKPPKARRFEISGIYETSLEDFDKLYILGDIANVKSLNDWENDQISGFEVSVDNVDELEHTAMLLKREIGTRFNDDGSTLMVTNIKEKNNLIFDWMGLFNYNVIVIIVMMLVVAGINITSGLLIVVLEKTRMIGILKSLGTGNASVKNIFLYIASFITLRGLFWGNLSGLLICFLQHKFQFIKLDPSAYFLNAVPVNINFIYLALINSGAFFVIFLVLLLPSRIISGINPADTIKYE